ncbi:MAG: protease inhibitor I42 family protein [Myxococcota bacterium]|nr:protease inhibitor I42 family protein [Myxococcota bacterium]
MESSRTPASAPSGPVICPRPITVVVDGQKINGTTVTVAFGNKLVVELPKQPANGYKWGVSSVPRELGQPTVENSGGDRKAGGSKGSTTFTWAIGGPLIQAGVSYEVTIGLKRPWEAKAAETIVFKVKVA